MVRARAEPLTPTIGLARTVELALGGSAAYLARARKRLAPDIDARVEEIGDGLAVTSGPAAGRNSSRAFGLGTAAPIHEDIVREVEHFYRGHRAAAVETTPLSHPSLFDALAARGFRVESFSSVLAGRPARRPRTRGIDIEPLSASHLDVVARVVRGALGDVEHERVRLTALPLLESPFSMFVARVGREPVGIGSVVQVGDVVLLLAGMTSSAYRGRGVQGALIDARMRWAHREGARLVVSMAEPGSTSERNLRRAGLSALYTATMFTKAADPAA